MHETADGDCISSKWKDERAFQLRSLVHHVTHESKWHLVTSQLLAREYGVQRGTRRRQSEGVEGELVSRHAMLE